MLQHVLAPDVENDRHLGLHGDDVSEVLVRADTQVDPSRFRLLQVLDNVLKCRFIRNEIVRAEKSAGLGEVRYDLPKCLIAELRRKGVRRNKRNGREA